MGGSSRRPYETCMCLIPLGYNRPIILYRVNMPNPLVECIPNFSEARRPEVVEAILDSIRAVAGVHLLDRHSDMDHNRTVVTMIGAPAAVEEAAFRSIKKAAELINLDEHTGAHPRIGATDVVPFVPIDDMTMGECVEIARRLGKRVGGELAYPSTYMKTPPPAPNAEPGNHPQGAVRGLEGRGPHLPRTHPGLSARPDWEQPARPSSARASRSSPSTSI